MNGSLEANKYGEKCLETKKVKARSVWNFQTQQKRLENTLTCQLKKISTFSTISQLFKKKKSQNERQQFKLQHHDNLANITILETYDLNLNNRLKVCLKKCKSNLDLIQCYISIYSNKKLYWHISLVPKHLTMIVLT